MKWYFNGFENWTPARGALTMMQGFDVFRASESSALPRDMCKGCVCWREFGTCTQVQVNDYEADAQMRRQHKGSELPTGCMVERNCCPILFFSFIGHPLPILDLPVQSVM